MPLVRLGANSGLFTVQRFYAVLCASARPGRREALSVPHGAGRPRAGGSRDSQSWRTGASTSGSVDILKHRMYRDRPQCACVRDPRTARAQARLV